MIITCISLLVNAFMSCSRKALGTLTRMYEIKPKLRRRRDGKGTSSGVNSVQFSLSHVQLFATPWTAVHQASLSITNSQSLPRLMPIELVMPSSHLFLCRPLLLPPSIFPSIRVFSSESALCIRWLKDWSFNFSISPSSE